MDVEVDGNLLFGILALQNEFVDRGELVRALKAWAADKTRPLGEILVEQGALDSDVRPALEAMLALHIRQHGGKAVNSLARLSSATAILAELANIDDSEIHASLDAARLLARAGLTVDDASRRTAPHDSTRELPAAIDDDEGSGRTTAGGRFRVLRFHRAGGMGRVSLAEDAELPRQVALKEIKPDYAEHAESRARFLLEAEINGGLEHPGIVPVYGLGTFADGRPFYAMRFVEGDSFKDAIARFHGSDGVARSRDPERIPTARSLASTPPHAKAVDFASLEFRGLLRRFVDVCHAMQYAHDRGVLHRDLKPDNVMLGKYGETLIVDWGLAKAKGKPDPTTIAESPAVEPRHADGVTPTRAGEAKGTLAYMSPEQAAGRLDLLGPATDVYSLGATLYHMLVGRPPITGKDAKELVQRVLAASFEAPRQANPNVPHPLEAVCLKAMAVEPAHRYADCRSLLREIEAYLADEPVTAWREPPAARARRWVRKHAAWTAAVTAAALVAGIALGIGFVAVSRAYDRERAAKREAQNNEILARQNEAAAKENAELAKANEVKALHNEGLAKANAARAETEFRRAKKAIDDYFTDVAESNELKARFPGMQAFRTKLFEKAEQYYQAFVKERGDDPTLQFDAAMAYFRSGQIAAEVGRPNDAFARYQKASDLLEKLVAATPQSAEYATALARTYGNVGSLWLSKAAYDLARASYDQALAVQEKLMRDWPAQHRYAADVANTHNNYAITLLQEGNRKAALARHAKALAIREQLARDHPDVADYASAVAMSHNNIGVLCRFEKDLPSAESHYRKSVAVREKLVARYPENPQYRGDLATSITNLGNVLKISGQVREAETLLLRGLGIREQLAGENPASLQYAVDLGGNYCNVGILIRDSQAPGKSVEYFDKAIAVLAKHAQVNFTAKEYLRNSYWGRAKASDMQGQYDRALADVDLALKLSAGQGATELQSERRRIQAAQRAQQPPTKPEAKK